MGVAAREKCWQPPVDVHVNFLVSEVSLESKHNFMLCNSEMKKQATRPHTSPSTVLHCLLVHAMMRQSTNLPSPMHAPNAHAPITQTICNFKAPGNALLRGSSSGDHADWAACILVNGSFPGPTIVAQLGDWVLVNVTSTLLSNLISIHYHGIDQVNDAY